MFIERTNYSLQHYMPCRTAASRNFRLVDFDRLPTRFFLGNVADWFNESSSSCENLSETEFDFTDPDSIFLFKLKDCVSVTMESTNRDPFVLFNLSPK